MSFDFYLRLDPTRLDRMRFHHLESQIDSASPPLRSLHAQEGAWLTDDIVGYTEWQDAEGLGLSLGWDWIVRVPDASLAVCPHSIRTNIMLIAPGGEDLGRAQTEAVLQLWLAGWDWASTVLAALGTERCMLGDSAQRN